MRKVNYDRFPSTKITGTILQGWDAVHTLLVECFKVKKVVAVVSMRVCVRKKLRVSWSCCLLPYLLIRAI